MNGTSRLYRSTSEAMLGGVAAGLGNYLKVDPVLVRAAFVILTLITGGTFLIVYLAMWLLIPTAGSTATQPGQIMQENLNEVGERVRGLYPRLPDFRRLVFAEVQIARAGVDEDFKELVDVGHGKNQRGLCCARCWRNGAGQVIGRASGGREPPDQGAHAPRSPVSTQDLSRADTDH